MAARHNAMADMTAHLKNDANRHRHRMAAKILIFVK